MIEFAYGDSKSGREKVLKLLDHERVLRPDLQVLDVGASDDPWSRPDAVLDIHKGNFSGITFFGNINDADGWVEVMSHASFGKFDFSICSHTLEDIAYPALTLRLLPYVARAGYIAVPSHYRELSRGLEYSSKYRGYFHHRWILVPDNGVLTLVPKISALEYMDIEGDPSDEKSELQIWWKDEIPFTVLNQDYLGPNQPTIMQMYKDLFERVK